ADVDDDTASGLLEDGQHSPNAVVGSDQIDGDVSRPFRRIRRLDPGDRVDDACIVDQDRRTPEGPLALAHRLDHALIVGDVAGKGNRPAAISLDFTGDPFACSATSGDNDYGRAFLCQRAGSTFADAAI